MTAPERIETGKVQVGDDWPAVLIRGDHALHYAMTLQAYLAGGEGAEVNRLIHRAVLDGLAKTLAEANAHNGVEPVMLTRATPTPLAALELIAEELSMAIQDDCEHGVRTLNEQAAANYLKEYPHTRDAIRKVLGIVQGFLDGNDT